MGRVVSEKELRIMKYRAALIGCGRIGCGFDDIPSRYVKTHAGAYSKHNKTTLCALCDIDESKLRKYGKKFGVKNTYTDYKKMLDSENIDLLSICTLNNSHLQIIKEAVNHNVKGIFVEKPIADSMEAALKIKELCEENNIKLLVDFQRRFIPIYDNVKIFLNDKKLGKIQRVNVSYGSGIANTGSHFFDMLSYFFGEAISVNFEKSYIKSNNKKDPNLDGRVIFRDGIHSIILSLDVSHYGILEMDVFGTKGRLKIDMVNHFVDYFRISSQKYVVYKFLQRKKFPNAGEVKEPLLRGITNLINSIEGKENLLCESIHGINSLELVSASLLSMKTNKEVHLPLKIQNFLVPSN